MKCWNSQLYKKKSHTSDIDRETLKNVIKVGDSVTSKYSCLPIFTFSHLCKQSSSDPKKLDKAVMRRNIKEDISNYRTFNISKNSKPFKTREISIPCPELLNIQKFIHEHILLSIPSHPSVFSYKKGSKIYEAAEIHCDSEWLIKVDIKDFFDSINEIHVYRVFRSIGYPALLSFQMARLCTKAKAKAGLNLNKQVNTSKKYALEKYSNKMKGVLPQGAPTSPILSNLIGFKMDEALQKIADGNEFIYSRYADDICFSSPDKALDREFCLLIVKKIYKVINNQGFEPNDKKLRIVPPGARKVILGLIVNGPKPHLSKSFKKNLLTHLHFCNRSDVGPALHSQQKKFASIIGFRNHLKGLVSYAKQIDSNFGAKVLKEYEKIIWPI